MSETNTDEMERLERRRDRQLKGQKTAAEENSERLRQELWKRPAASSEPYRLDVHNVGGREPDGEPTYIGPWTFSTKMVRDVVEGTLHGRVFNACAGKTELTYNGEIVRNDLNPERNADTHVDVCEIRDHFDAETFDVVIFDPPFDQAQADEHYKSMHARQLAPARKQLSTLVRPGGTFVELGWNMHGPAVYDGWQRKELHLFNRGPTLQPMFLSVDDRLSKQSNFAER